MKKSYKLGELIYSYRSRHSVKCVELARKLGISTGYLSQLESGCRVHPSPALILKIVNILELSSQESILLFDLYSEATGQLPPDITEYLMGNQAALQALRQARDANATMEDWERFIGQLKK